MFTFQVPSCSHRRCWRFGGSYAYVAVLFALAAISCQQDLPRPDDSAKRHSVQEIIDSQANAVIDVEAEPVGPQQPNGHRQMVQLLAEVAKQTPITHPYLGHRELDGLREQLQVVSPSADLTDKWQLLAETSELELQMGHEEEAIALMDQVNESLDELAGHIPNEAIVEILFRGAVAYLRYGETENCCLRHNADSCLLPIRGGGIHTKQEGSRRAAQILEELLQRADSSSPRYFEAIWLLNIAYMTLGEYPEAVPAEFRIPPERFQSEVDFPRFTNIAAELGLDTFNLSGGVIADDFDNDGRIDLMVGPWDPREALRYYHQESAGRFVECTAQAGLDGISGGLNMIQADYNNDGFVDAFVLRGAWLSSNGRHPNSLLKNNGDGTFTDVTIDSGLAKNHYPTQTAAWADYDLDGDLDLYIGNEPLGTEQSPSELWRNNGDGTFTDIAASARVTNFRFAKGAVWGDYDNDRFPDLFVSNLNQPNRLYHNNGDGTFSDVAHAASVQLPLRSFPTWFWDYDNDGNLDLFVGAYDGSVQDVAQYYLYGIANRGQIKVYRGNGKGKFFDASSFLGLDEPAAPMGANFGDIDNDGFLDFYLGTGFPLYSELMPNKFYRNQHGRRFVDVSVSAGLSSLQKGHAIAFADFDDDGDLDIFHQMGGAYPGDKYVNALYENPGFGNHWLRLKLVGRESNRSAIGTRIRIELDMADERAVVHRRVCSGGSFGASPLMQQIGLGPAERIVALEIYWPASDTTQRFESVAMDTAFIVEEGGTELKHFR